MKLNLVEKRKADNYTGDSLTYALNVTTIEQKKQILTEISKLEDIDIVKIKIEYVLDGAMEVDSFYSKNLTKEMLDKYMDISFVKIKANISNVRTSFTLDFKDEYIRIKANYEKDMNEEKLIKIVKHITKNI